MKSLIILGSTGSIGTQALEVIAEHDDLYEVYCLTAYNQVDLLAEQARRFKPDAVVIANEAHYERLCSLLDDCPDIKVYAGAKALDEIVQADPIDMVLTAMVGFAGLTPTVNAIKARKKICLANKETLVVAGEIIMNLAQQNRCPILPVDSEHSAIFQSLVGDECNEIEKILLTASGGPFRTFSLEQMQSVTAADALRHPTWDMGAKITIDSASMMNKGFEVIEARWLFGTPGERIHVVVHPESIIHSMVEYADGSVIAQMGHPDMREAIQFAFCFPHRLPLDNKKLNFAELGSMSFEAPDHERFPALGIAYEALRKGGNMPCIMNAANEAAVAAFLQEKIGFYDITDVVSDCMAGAEFAVNPDLDTIFRTNEEAYVKALERIAAISGKRSF